MAYMALSLVCLYVLSTALLPDVFGYTDQGNLTDSGIDQNEITNVPESEEYDYLPVLLEGDYDYNPLTLDSECVLNFLDQGGDERLIDVVCPRKWPSNIDELEQSTLEEEETSSTDGGIESDSASKNPSGDNDIAAFTSNPDHFMSSNENPIEEVAVPTISTKDRNSDNGLENHGEHLDEDRVLHLNTTAVESLMTAVKEDGPISLAVKEEDIPVTSDGRGSAFMSDLDDLLIDTYGDSPSSPNGPSSNDVQGDTSKLKKDESVALVKDVSSHLALLYIENDDSENETKSNASLMNQGTSGTQMHEGSDSALHQDPVTEGMESTNANDIDSHAMIMMAVELSVFLGSLFALVAFTLWLHYRTKEQEDTSPSSWLSDKFVIPRPWRRLSKAQRFSWEFSKI
ncbi:uncharacterized protein LOC144887874 [Branchiostoma floridae x Branchiostoma japonicum]